jgi:hypothetical protein
MGRGGSCVSLLLSATWRLHIICNTSITLVYAMCFACLQVLQQPDERIPGGKTARQQALEQLAVKYCTNRGGGPRSSVQVEAEMLAHIASAEKKSKLLEDQLKHVRLSSRQHSWQLYLWIQRHLVFMACQRKCEWLPCLCWWPALACYWLYSVAVLLC